MPLHFRSISLFFVLFFSNSLLATSQTQLPATPGGIYFNSGWLGVYFQSRGYVPYGYSYWDRYNNSAQYSTYGSISYSPSNNSFGWSFSEYNRIAAARSSYAYCGFYDCQEVVWVQSGCAAVASASNGANMSWSYHTDRWYSQQAALSQCRAHAAYGQPCELRAWVCSGQ